MFKKGKLSEKEISAQSNILSQSTTIEGNIHTQGNFRLEGVILGNVKCDAKFISSDSSKITGNIDAFNAEISGEILGDILVKELLVLRASTKIKGNIVTNKLMIEPGATVDGNFKTNLTISSLKEEIPASPKKTSPKIEIQS